MISTMSRIVVVVQNMPEMTHFYRDILELRPIFDPKTQPTEWLEFNTGGCRIALEVAELRDGVASTYNKITFNVEDVAGERDQLLAKGAPMGEVIDDGRFQYSEGSDPEGNKFQVSNRPA